jgi:CPA2 family monovalent cation:H+ antiporter-2
MFILVIAVLRWLLAKWLIPLLAAYRSPELVLLFTIVALGGVTLAAYSVGLPPAVGAFAAGLIFNGNRWTQQIDALVLPFRETFSAVFFIGLGLIFNPGLFLREPLIMLTMLASVILMKAIAATIALKLTGLSLRTSFGMGIGLAHIGEFAFVLVLLGWQSDVLDVSSYQRLVAVAVGSLVLTPPLMTAGLRLIRGEHTLAESETTPLVMEPQSRRATIIGAGPIGGRMASQLETMGKEVCLVDLSPINLQPYTQAGFCTVAGDASDVQILVLAGVPEAALSVVCVPQDNVAVRIVREIRRINPACRLIVRCRYQSSVSQFSRLGVDVVVVEETEATMGLLRALSRFDENHPTA